MALAFLKDAACFFKSSTEVFAWIGQYINFEQVAAPKKFSLERMYRLAARAGNPEKSVPVIHIAGSKAKGSVAALCSALLEAAGFTVILYTSPHLTDYRERIKLGTGFLEESVYCAAGDEMRAVIEESGEEPTFFEACTLFFFLCMRSSSCDYAVVETGLGGRLDATNIVEPILSLITPIELEHTQYLGTTVAAIAREKAGIIKPNRPVIVAEQDPEAYRVLKQYAEEQHAPFYYVPEYVTLNALKVTVNGTSFSYCQNGTPPFPLSLSLHGAIQAQNASVAVFAIRQIIPTLEDTLIYKALSAVKIPGRFERVSTAPLCVRDGAHTPLSFRATVKTFCTLYGHDGVLLFACAADKDFRTMVQHAVPHFSQIIISTPGFFKASNPSAVYQYAINEAAPVHLSLIEDPHQAIAYAKAVATTLNKALLITGSFYLIALV
ncbi:MAG: bifunctional folylpolyglutamate synthase/dihydrofolate synthase [Treponema sp.]|jgi:dihydrofolate synthase/folylpolyglutamate synthase|nr:bifunctional folylpolyglutamate synthase/dihydrofolate synthase [Treponema sp.]